MFNEQITFLSSSDIVYPGKQYTFILDMSRLIGYDRPAYIKDQLTFYMKNYGGIILVDKSLLYRGYTVTVSPTTSYRVSDWGIAFNYSFTKLGYSGTTIVYVYEGLPIAEESISKSIAKGTGETVATALKPLLPYILIIGGSLLVISILPQLLIRK